MKLIDTDILIDHFHGHQAAFNFITQQIVGGEVLAISVVTITEFAGGSGLVKKSGQSICCRSLPCLR